VPESKSTPISTAQIRDSVERIVRGASFRDSPAAARLLEFLVRWSLSGKSDELKETTIAIEFFRRDSNFDSRYDNSVRMNVSRLRSRLAAYYAADGLTDPIIIEIPKGCYVPAYRERPQESPGKQDDPGTASRPPGISRLLRYVVIFLMVAAAFGLGTWTARSPSAASETGESLIKQLFGRFADKQTALICRNIALLRVDKRFPLMLLYGGRTEASSQEKMALPPDVPTDLRRELGNRDVRYEDYWSDAGSIAAAFNVSRIFARLHQSLTFYTTRSVDPNQLRNENLIVVSTPWFNPITPYLAHFRHFQIQAVGPGIKTRSEPGHSPEWLTAENDPDSKALLSTLALVALQPGLSAGTHLLRITGVDPIGVEGGVSFVTSEAGLKELAQGLRRQSIPDRFEAVLRVHCLRGQVAGVEFVQGFVDSD